MAKMVEVEIRILLKKRKRIEQKLRDLGAKVVYFAHVDDRYFCPRAAKNYLEASLDKTKFCLRIREAIDHYSGKKKASLECKTLHDGKNHAMCDEHEIDIEDVPTTRHILQNIGLKEFLHIDKERIIYQFKKYKFVFEKIKHLGDGLEIEVLTRKDVEIVHQELLKLAEALGIGRGEIVEKSLTYLAMQKISRF